MQPSRWHLTDALKLFLPSWKFFADSAEVPRLEVRAADGPWLDLFPPQEVSSLGRLLFNAAGNQRLLEQSQMDRAVDALEDLRDRHPSDWHEAFRKTERHAVLVRLVRAHWPEPLTKSFQGASDCLQFRLALVHPEGRKESLFVSERFSGQHGSAS